MDNPEENLDQTAPSTQPEKESKKPSKKPMSFAKKVFYWILAFFILLMLSIPLILNFYAERIFGETIRQIVKKETGGRYVFSYQKIGFNLFLSDLTITDLAISPDSAFQTTDSAGSLKQQKLIELKIPELHFTGSGIYNVIRKKELVVNRFYLGKPGLKLYLNLPEQKAVNTVDSLPGKDSDQRILHVYLKDYLKLLKIIDFELNDGNLEIIRGPADSAQSIKISNFSVLLSNLQVDSLSTQKLENLLFSDSLGVSFKSGHFEFLGNRHFLTFNNINIVTSQHSVEIGGLVVRRDSLRTGNAGKSWVDLSVPTIKLTDFNFQDFASKKLTVSEIIIIEPDIIFHPAKGDDSQKVDAEKLAKQIFEALSGIFYPIEVGKISIQSANFRIDGFESKNLKEVYLPDFSVDLVRFKMDSVSYAERSRQFFIDDFRLIMNEQEFFLKKSARLIKFGYFDLDTRTSQLELCDVSVEDLRKNPQTASLNLRIPVLSLAGKDFKKDFFDNKLRILNLEIQEPALSVHIPDSLPPNSEKFDIHLLYSKIDGFLKELSVDSLKISRANFDFGRFRGIFANQFSSPDVSLLITGFLLNKDADKNTARLFYSSGIEIEAANLAVLAPDSIHQLLFDNMKINTKDSAIHISGLHTDTLETMASRHFFAYQKDHFNFDVDEIALKGVDFGGFYNNQFIQADTIKISNLVGYFIEVLADKGKPKDAQIPLPGFQIGHVQLDGGNFYVKEIPGNAPKKIAFDGMNLSFDCLRPAISTQKNKIEAENLRLSSENLMINLAEKGYSIEMNKLKISSADSLIKASNLLLQPLNPAQGKDKFIVRAKIPGFSVKGIALGQLYENNLLKASEIHLEKPSYRLIFTKKSSPTSEVAINEQAIKTEILKIIGSVDVARFWMNNADIEVFGGTTFSSRELLIGDFDLEISHFLVDSSSNMTRENLFFTNDIRFSARNEIKASVGDDFDVSFSRLSGSTKGGFLKAEGIILNGNELNKDKIQSSKITDIELMVKNLDLKGIDFYKFINGQKLTLERISANEPDVWLTREITGQVAKSSENKEIDFYKIISKQISQLQIDDVDISNASVKFVDKKGKNSETRIISRIDADFRNILIDSANNVFGEKFLYSDLFNLKISDYSYLTPDSLYLMGAATIGFTSKNSVLKIDSGFLTPQFEEEVFAAKVGHQTDRFNLVFDSANFANIKIPDLLSRNSISVSKGTIYQLIADDYRNKSYEILPDHYASLPVSGLKNLPFLLNLDTLNIENSRIQYREYVLPAFEPGAIWFDGLTLKGLNITNDSAAIARNRIMNFTVDAKMMNEANVSLLVNFDLQSWDDWFFATGTLDKLDLTSMNPFLENVAFVKVKKGTNNKLSFDFNGNNDVARGELLFDYDKLAIKLIDKETMQDRGFGESVASFIANNFIVRSDNPKYTVLFRRGKIYFERNKQKSFFNFVAKSVLSGISTTIRGGNEERKEKRKKRKLDNQTRPEARLNEEESFYFQLQI